MLINITMPVYNTNGHVLLNAVKSVLNQTETRYKLLMFDDGSTDVKTLQVLSRLAALNTDQIQVIHNTQNQGIAVARNRLLDYLDPDCEFVVIFDHDDIMEPNKLEKQLRYFETHEVDFLGTQILPMDFVPPNKNVYYNKTKHPLIVTRQTVCSSLWFVNNPTVMIKRCVYEKVGKYSTQEDIVKYGIEDYEFVTRCFLAGIKIHNLPESLLIYRRHNNQASRKDPTAALQIVQNIQNKLRQELNFTE